MPHRLPGFARLLRAGVGCALVAGAAALPAAAMASRGTDSSLPAMPYQVVVPGLSAGAAPVAATPTAVPDAAVTVTGISLSNLNGDGTITNLTVFGNVHNGLDYPIGDVQLAATAEGADGSILSTGVATARLDVIPAGGDAPFSLPLQRVTDLNTPVSVSVTSYTGVPSVADAGLVASVQPPQPFKVGMKDPKTGLWPDSPNLLAANGAITNNSSSAERIDNVTVAFQDSGGKVWLVATTDVFAATFPGADPQVLPPGQSGTFTVYVPRALWLTLPADAAEHVYVNSTASQ